MTHVLLTEEQAQQIEEALAKVVDRELSSHANDNEALATIRAARAKEQAKQEPVRKRCKLCNDTGLVSDGGIDNIGGEPHEEYKAYMVAHPEQPVSQKPIAKLNVHVNGFAEVEFLSGSIELDVGNHDLYIAPRTHKRPDGF